MTVHEEYLTPDSAKGARLRTLSAQVRATVLQMIADAGSGHVGSSLSCVDVLTALRFEQMTWAADDSRREVFVLSKGHAAPAWYSALIVGGDLDRS
jgi:transketolase